MLTSCLLPLALLSIVSRAYLSLSFQTLSLSSLSLQSPILVLILISRHVLQLHHDDGGEQRGVDGGGAQLSPQDGRDPCDAYVGPQCLLTVAPLDTQDG